MGEVHPYVEKIALTKWVNRELGSNILPKDWDGPNPALDEHELDWLLTYSATFSDPKVREAAKFHAKTLRERGVFSAVYELGTD